MLGLVGVGGGGTRAFVINLTPQGLLALRKTNWTVLGTLNGETEAGHSQLTEGAPGRQPYDKDLAKSHWH